MIVLVLLVLAGLALGIGYSREQTELVQLALGLSVVAAALVLLGRFGPHGLRSRLTGVPPGEGGPADGSA